MNKKLFNELKRLKFFDYAFRYIEIHYIDKEFHGASLINDSVNEFYSLEESSQIGVQLSAKLFSAFYSYMRYNVNEFLINNDSFLRVLTVRDDTDKRSYDCTFQDINTLEHFKYEIKLSQNPNSWQGSTSTTQKVDDFILINMEINRDLPIKVGDNKGFFNGIFVGLVDLSNKTWVGEAKDNSHRTIFEFRMDSWNLDFIKNDVIIKGGINPKIKKYHLIREELNYD